MPGHWHWALLHWQSASCASGAAAGAGCRGGTLSVAGSAAGAPRHAPGTYMRSDRPSWCMFVCVAFSHLHHPGLSCAEGAHCEWLLFLVWPGSRHTRADARAAPLAAEPAASA
eukprot:scaffold8630_cov115-Isochrysis_galbana.AAC.7